MSRKMTFEFKRMKFTAIVILLFMGMICSVRAALIPRYTMSELAHLSGGIVLCQEKDLRVIEIQHDTWVGRRTIVRCTPIRVFKGELPLDADFEVVYDSLYRRSIKPREVYKNAGGNVLRVIEPDYFPAGRALVFFMDLGDPSFTRLRNELNQGTYYVQTAKLLRDGEVFEFGQFESNPGGLCLRKQQPERIKLRENQKYGEAELIEDLLLSIKNAAPPVDQLKLRFEREQRRRVMLRTAVIGGGVILSAGLVVGFIRRKRRTGIG